MAPNAAASAPYHRPINSALLVNVRFRFASAIAPDLPSEKALPRATRPAKKSDFHDVDGRLSSFKVIAPRTNTPQAPRNTSLRDAASIQKCWAKPISRKLDGENSDGVTKMAKPTPDVCARKPKLVRSCDVFAEPPKMSPPPLVPIGRTAVGQRCALPTWR